YAITLLASAVAVVLPVGAWTALVAAGSLIGRRRGREVWWAAGAAALATAVSVFRDARGGSSATSLIKTLLAPVDSGPTSRWRLPGGSLRSSSVWVWPSPSVPGWPCGHGG